LAEDLVYSETLAKKSTILEEWIADTDGKGQYPENMEVLKLMLGIWGGPCGKPRIRKTTGRNT
jgi:N-sulfoglucosamine sulfohydrolase